MTGKLKIESQPQQFTGALENLSKSEIDTRLYDKYSVSITEVKALLADSGKQVSGVMSNCEVIVE